MSDAASRVAEALTLLGFDRDPEMKGTATAWVELLREYTPAERPPEIRVLPTRATTPVVLTGLPYHSLCAHHLVPFFGFATVAYLPDERLVGLGNIPRLLRYYARRPQLQERLAEELASALDEAMAPRALVVRLSARQMCMEMRGAESAGEVWVEASRGDAAALAAHLGPLVRG